MSDAIFRSLSEKEDNESSTADTSTKTRRLAPAFTLSRKDFSAVDRNVPVVQRKGLHSIYAIIDGNFIFSVPLCYAESFYYLPLKLFALSIISVIRFSRDDIMNLRRASRVLSSMVELPDVVSIPPLDPINFRQLEQEEVSLWLLLKDPSTAPTVMFHNK
jgi:hypothetical protein